MTPVATRIGIGPAGIALAVLLLAVSVSRGAADGVAADSLAAGGEAPAGAAAVPPPAPVRAWQTGLLRPDRLTHASLALGIGVGVGMLRRSPGTGAGAALGIGLVKELTDERFDRGDLLADAVGAGLAALLVAALTR